MTKNNLHKCLGWLLQQVNTIQANSLTHVVSVDTFTNDEFGDGIDVERVLENQAMARLQLAPRSTNKPRMIRRQHEQTPPTQTASTGTHRNASPSTRDKSARMLTPVRLRTEIPPTPATDYGSIGVFDIDDIDEIVNLREENVPASSVRSIEEHTEPRQEASIKWNQGYATKGQKRTSDEFFSDVKGPQLKRRQDSPHKHKRIALASNPGVKDELFKSSSLEAGHARPDNENPVIAQHATDGTQVSEQVEQPEAECDDIARGPQIYLKQLEGQKKASRPVILDSEDENDIDMSNDRSEVEALYKTSLAPNPVKILSTEDNSITRAGPSNCPETVSITDEIRATGLQCPIAENVSLTTISSKTAECPVSSSNPSTGAMSKSHDDTQKVVLSEFLGQSSGDVQQHLANLEAEKKELSFKIAAELCDEEFVSPNLMSSLSRLKARIKSLKEVMMLKQVSNEKSSERELLKRQLHQLLEDDMDIDPNDPDDKMAETTRKIRLLRTEVDAANLKLQALLQDVGWLENFPQGDACPVTARRNVLVASTQNTPAFVTQSPRCRSPTKPASQEPQMHQISQTPSANKQRVSPTLAKPYSNFTSNATFLKQSNTVTRYNEVADFDHQLSAVSYDQPHYSRNMGSPAPPIQEANDFYGDFDDEDDEDMMDVAQAVEQSFTSGTSNYLRPNERAALSEISHNTRRSSLKASSKECTPVTQFQHAWSKDVMLVLRKRFHLHDFRHNQLEAINSTLEGKDTFVLMPTGGGKSLCYQLPAVVQSGKTRGVTIVISPLLSLMQDQVDHLQKLKVQAFMVNSEVTAEHRKLVFHGLKDPDPQNFIQLLYVTPEMLGKSQAMLSALENLYKRRKLARIVIDEAHCVSQWGHDFRPDYKNLGPIRDKFPGVPVIALTATATENVKIDTIHNLGMSGCRVFTQSFNRPNLSYEVRPKLKGNQTLQSIAETINTYHAGESGIVYCLSRKNCEQVAEKLEQQHGIKSAHYHAGMPADTRSSVQKDWQRGKYDVIVATIAFGMGIDKPDVRFVIHHTIPKSLEGYYQETGRAGRDGKPSQCYLYYGYSDTTSLKRMIDDGDGSWEQKERQKHMLRNVVQFCENKSDCRRVQVLAYFNEHFNSEDCNESCDNCKSGASFEMKDFSDHAKDMISLVRRVSKDKVTLLHCVDLYRGAKSKKAQDAGHDELPEYGKGSILERGDVERLYYRLLTEDAIEEYNEVNKMGFASQYVKLGPKYREFSSGHRSLTFQVRVSSGRKPRAQGLVSKRKKGSAKNADETEDEQDDESSRFFPTSTIISSPIESRSRGKNIHRKKQSTITGSKAGTDADFEGVVTMPEAGVRKAIDRHVLGPPITLDQQLTHLDQYHRHILNDFIEQARRQLNRIAVSKSLRQVSIPDTVLREIGIHFPLTANDLRSIKGMDEDKVSRYGSVLLPLVRQSHADYQALLGVDSNEGNVSLTMDDVVIISEDESFEGSDVGSSDDEENEDEQFESSRSFGVSEGVAAFNQRMSQTQMLTTGSRSTLSRKKTSNTRGTQLRSSRKTNHPKSGSVKPKSRTKAGATKKKRSSTAKSSGGAKNSIAMNKLNAATKKSSRDKPVSAFSEIGMMPT